VYSGTGVQLWRRIVVAYKHDIFMLRWLYFKLLMYLLYVLLFINNNYFVCKHQNAVF